MLAYRENNTNRFALTDHPVMPWEIGVNLLEGFLLDPDFRGVLWDHHGLRRVLTREILQEGLNTYYAAHRNPRAAIAPHAGVFLWDQTISHEEADQRGKASSGESPGSENEPDQSPLEP